MLKQGDLIIADEGRDIESWWVMDRDEEPGDYRNCDHNSRCILDVSSTFAEDPTTSWDSSTVVEQNARVVPEAEVTDEMWARIAKYQLTGE